MHPLSVRGNQAGTRSGTLNMQHLLNGKSALFAVIALITKRIRSKSLGVSSREIQNVTGSFPMKASAVPVESGSSLFAGISVVTGSSVSLSFASACPSFLNSGLNSTCSATMTTFDCGFQSPSCHRSCFSLPTTRMPRPLRPSR
jgi:hypothetical protein